MMVVTSDFSGVAMFTASGPLEPAAAVGGVLDHSPAGDMLLWSVTVERDNNLDPPAVPHRRAGVRRRELVHEPTESVLTATGGDLMDDAPALCTTRRVPDDDRTDAEDDMIATIRPAELSPTTPTRDRPLRRWMARWWSAGTASRSRPAEVLAVLQQAYAIVEAGWVQNRWYVTAPAAPAPAASAHVVAPAGPEVRACVVGAVALAVRARNPQADLAVDTGPALAFVWDAVRDQTNPGYAGGRARRAAGRAAPHEERVARMRDLARWNDEQGRTRADVLAALDRAAARATEAAVEPVRS
jgi:hypothetical protein